MKSKQLETGHFYEFFGEIVQGQNNIVYLKARALKENAGPAIDQRVYEHNAKAMSAMVEAILNRKKNASKLPQVSKQPLEESKEP